MRFLIVEDEPPAQLQLKKLLRELRPDAQIVAVLDSVENAVDFFRSAPAPDLAFFDIQLADNLSFEIFNQIEVTSPVIFTTAYDQYSLRAFKVNSVDYLLKPVEPEELAKALEKYEKVHQGTFTADRDLMRRMLQSMREPAYKERFLIRSGQQLSYIRTSELRYVYSEEGLTLVRTAERLKYHLDYSLDQLEGLLDPKWFFRLNRKVITHLDAIGRISPYFNSRLILHLKPEPDFDVIVSRDRVQGFKEWLDR